jgi:hypothetical protein
MKKGILIITVTWFCALQSIAQNVKMEYKENREDISNPERGFYIPTGTRAGNFILLDAKLLKAYRIHPQQIAGASYSVNVSLIYRGYELDAFVHQPLSDAFLQKMQQDFDAVREAGLKMILRFAYTNTAKSGACKDEYAICPPYGDAPRAVVLNHIKQLKPLLQKNADVIAVLQEGFIGIWGENYFTDYFGDASTNGAGKILDSSWHHRNELLKALLDALPRSRMVQVRTPQIKQKFVYGPSAMVNSLPLKLSVAFTGSYQARIGFHNDCFLSTPDDYGTYYDYGSSALPRQPANEVLRKYIAADTKFTAVGGETCDDAFSPQNDCAPFGYAEKEMAAMHFSYLNAAYNNQVNNDWDSLGCMKNIQQKLGYRLVLQNAVFPVKAVRGKKFTVQLQLENKGYAAPFNPRPVQFILRNKQTGKIVILDVKTNIQKWFTGKVVLQQEFVLPASIEKGEYELLLNLPDGFKRLQGNPLYSIRLANEDMWEASTGFNDLKYILKVK